MYKIYKYTNIVNGMVYIGQTSKTLKERASSNGLNYKECTYFWNAIQKYGWHNFKSEILKDNLNMDEANYWEEFFIKQYDSTNRKNGYNICFGGNNHTMSDEQKQKISQLAKERYIDITKNPMFGKKHSQESINKMSIVKRGKNNPMFGKHLSEASKQKAIQTKINNGTFGAHHIYTEEEKQKCSIKFKEIAKKLYKKVKCIDDNLEFESITKCAEYYNVAISTLSGHLNGRQKTCCNKHFEFID